MFHSVPQRFANLLNGTPQNSDRECLCFDGMHGQGLPFSTLQRHVVFGRAGAEEILDWFDMFSLSLRRSVTHSCNAIIFWSEVINSFNQVQNFSSFSILAAKTHRASNRWFIFFPLQQGKFSFGGSLLGRKRGRRKACRRCFCSFEGSLLGGKRGRRKAWRRCFCSFGGSSACIMTAGASSVGWNMQCNRAIMPFSVPRSVARTLDMVLFSWSSCRNKRPIFRGSLLV